MDIEHLLKETEKKVEACFLCRLIHQDLRINKKLTGHPLTWSGEATFTVEGKKKHLQLEGIPLTPM